MAAIFISSWLFREIKVFPNQKSQTIDKNKFPPIDWYFMLLEVFQKS